MAEDFHPFVDSGDPAPSNTHLTPNRASSNTDLTPRPASSDMNPTPNPALSNTEGSSLGETPHSARISVYDDMLSTPRVIVIEQNDVRTYLEEITNTVYQTMKDQGGRLSLMIVRELVENFIHAHFKEPIISILDNGNTIRFSDQGPGIDDKELAFEFGITSANREMKRYIRGTGSGLPMIQQYVENAGGAIGIEDNLGAGTVVTVSVDPQRVLEIEQTIARGAAVRSGHTPVQQTQNPAPSNTNPTNTDLTNTYPTPNPTVPYINPNFSGYSPVPQYGYPQFNNQFSTIPQPYPQPAEMPVTNQVEPSRPQTPETIYISERGIDALRFLSKHPKGGPTALAKECGSSAPSWSRELAKLAERGFVCKPAQQYVITGKGRAWLQDHLHQ